jgi:hypothetical protein
MQLSADEADLFFRLQNALVLYANERLRVLPRVRDLPALQRCKLEDRLRLRDALYDHPELIDEFVAVLLPFKGRIIYDGLGGTYDIVFGPGVRASLNEDYQAIRERGEIIESLEPEAAGASAPRDRKAAGPARSRAGTLSEDTLALLERMAVDAERLRGADTPAAQRAFALLRAAVAMAQIAVTAPADATAWTRVYRRARTALHQLHTSLSRQLTAAQARHRAATGAWAPSRGSG